MTMNKIYLLILAFSTMIGFQAHAYSNVELRVNNAGSGNWDVFKSSKENTVNNNEQEFEIEFEITNTSGYVEFNIYSDGGNNRWGFKEDNKSIGLRDENTRLDKFGPNDNSFKNAHFSLSKGKYKMYFNPDVQKNWNPSNTNVAKCWIVTNDGGGGGGDVTTEEDYYFYGDMNRWSLLQNAGQQVSIQDINNVDYTDAQLQKIWGQDKTKWPKYYTATELKSIWRFKKVTSAMVNSGYLKTGVKLPSDVNANWYYLDFAKISDQGVHTGVLCGQFKITQGYYDDTDNGKWKDQNWGIGGDYSTTYFNKGVKVGKTTTIEKRSGLQNIVLDNNYVEDAVLYFDPNNNKIHITGTPKDLYVYYAVIGATPPSTGAGLTWLMSDMSQVNYYANTVGFNGRKSTEKDVKSSESDLIATGGNRVNPTDAAGSFKWENAPEDLTYNKYTFSKNNVIRRRIPAGATHRYPIQINVDFTDETGEKYKQQRVFCEDIWFVRNTAEVNLHFRYDTEDATSSLDWVCYNAFSENINKDGAVEGFQYLFGDKREVGSEPSITDGEWGTMTLARITADNEHKGELWWNTPVALPNDFTSGAWAMFADARGGVYPAERVNAQKEALNEVVISGNDVWYEAASFENPSILYSHLNGTFNMQRSSDNIIQINAEMFDPKTVADKTYALISDTSTLKYRFEVYRNGRIVACNDAQGGFVTGAAALTNSDYCVQPFFDWKLDEMNFENLTNTNPGIPGYYFILVKCDYNGHIYTAQDTYAVYDAKPVNP